MRTVAVIGATLLALASLPATAQKTPAKTPPPAPASPPATGGGTMVEAARPESIVAALQNAGYRAALEKDDIGEPKITSAANGAKFTIYFYGCDQHVNCRSLQFYAGYTIKTKPTPQKINEWIVNNRFSAAYLDKDGDPHIQWDVVTEGGMSEKLFAGCIERWTDAMGTFQTFIGWS